MVNQIFFPYILELDPHFFNSSIHAHIGIWVFRRNIWTVKTSWIFIYINYSYDIKILLT